MSRNQQISALFLAAADLPPEERGALLETRCAGDTELQREVERLLAHHADDSFLERPVVQVAGDRVAATPREQLGPYLLLRELGRGGQGVVWLAEDTVLNRPVALKVLSGLGAFSEQALQRFWREAEVAAKLDHRNLCAVYDAGQQDGETYIAMRYVPGESLQAILQSTRNGSGTTLAAAMSSGGTTASDAQPPTRSSRPRAGIAPVARFVEKLARALHEAHQHGVIHRDIKPANVMVTPDGEPVVLDFGLARETDAGVTLTQTGQVFGTPAYMSPEQIAPRQIRLDRRTDVYSLGVVLYECVTQRLPFDAPTFEGLCQAIRDSEPPSPRRIEPTISRDLCAVIETALEKDRNRRYQTALALADDLAAVAENRPVSVKPLSTAARALRWGRRRPVHAALAVLLALGIPAVSALVTYIASTRDEVLQQRQTEHRERIESLLEDGYVRLGVDNPLDAITVFERAIAATAEPPPAAIAGMVFAHYKSYDRAAALQVLDRFSEAVAGSPGLTRLRVSTLNANGRASDAEALAKTLGEPADALSFFVMAIQRTNAGERLTLGEHDASADFRAALELIDKAIRHADRPRALYFYERTRAAGRLRDADAIHETTRLITSRWDTPNSWFFAGFALSEIDPEAALAALARAPDNAVTRTLVGRALRQLGRNGEGIEAYRHAIAFDSNYYTAWFNLGVALHGKGLRDDAIEKYRRAIELRPRSAAAHFNLSNVLSELNRLDESIAEVRTALRLDPELSNARYNLGVRLAKQNLVEEALIEFGGVLARRPEAVDALCWTGDLLQRRRKLPEALDFYDKALALDAARKETQYNRGNALLKMGRFDEAAVGYRAAIALDANYAEALCNLGLVLRRLGRFREAADSLRRGHESGSARADWNDDASETWLRQAEKLAADADRLDRIAAGAAPPDDLEQVAAIAHAGYLQGRHAIAARLWRDAFARDAKWAADAGGRWRFEAACSAAMIGCDRVDDSRGEAVRARWRSLARRWLAADLADWLRAGEAGQVSADRLRRVYRDWQSKPHLAGVRSSEALARLPEPERSAWQAMWAEVANRLERRP